MRTDYDLQMEQRDGYVFVSVASDTDGRQKTERYIQEIASRCRHGKCRKVLIDKHIKDSFWLWDTMSLSDHIADFGVQELKVAIVDASGTQFGSEGFQIKTGTTINAHVFRTLEAAEDWLVSDSD